MCQLFVLFGKSISNLFINRIMRVVQIGAYPKSSDHIAGGVEASVYGLSQAQSSDNEVFVFDLPRIGGKQIVEQNGSVIVYRFANQGNRQIFSAKQVKRIAAIINSLSPDVCHIHGTGLFAWRMYKELKKARIHIVVTIHGLALVEKHNALKKGFSLKKLLQFFYQSWIEKRFLSSLPVAIVDTEYVKEKVTRYPIRRKPAMYVIPQGISETFFSLKCSKESKIILSVGAIGERKGHLISLKAFEYAVNKGVDGQFVIVGTVADKEYQERLRNAITQSEYSNKVSLFTNVSDETLIQLYEKAHLFVLHSEEESQGIVFAEALATGLPVVATNVGGVPYVVSNGENGLLSEYGDVTVFADNIKLLMTNKDLWQSMSESAVKAANNYHWANISERIMKIYQKIDC